MELPIKFPDEGDVIREDARRFRALSPNEQRHALAEMYGMYRFLLNNSDHPEYARQVAEREEARGRAAIEEFVARHGQ